jgi:hypothetical protein
MARRRAINVFSLSFLDIMSCGFGAVILVFIVINHSTEATSQEVNAELLAESQRLQAQLSDEQAHLVDLKTTVELVVDETITAEQVTAEIMASIETLNATIQREAKSGASQSIEIEKLKSELKLLEDETANLQGSVDGAELAGTSLRSFVGDGNRQYLTGLNVGGKHILILIDASASMLHRTIVNAIRLSNLPDEEKKRASKWQRAVRTVDWISANLPADAEFSLQAFNTGVNDLTHGGGWIATKNKAVVDQTLENLYQLVPQGGTSLHSAFVAASKMQPQPDNIFLIVDGLPTQGPQPDKKARVSSAERVRLYQAALSQLPRNIPVNIILFPMEGDPLATPLYWVLAQDSGGSFLSPSKDWP